ncbi:MAG: hypothetical protein ACI81R_003369, partial [Bradymonadia bacterium]
TAGAHDTDGDGWWDGWEVCGLTDLQPGDGRAIAANVFAGPAVRDLLLEVVVADNVSPYSPQRQAGMVNNVLANVRQTLGERPPPPFGDWSPLSYGLANLVEFAAGTAETRDEALAENAYYTVASGSQVVPILWSQFMRESYRDRPQSYYAVSFSVNSENYRGIYLLPNAFSVPTVIHEGGHAMCLGHDIPLSDSDNSFGTRNSSPVYGSRMNYANGYRLEADVSPRFSEGGRTIAAEAELTEQDVLNSSLSRAQYLSGFWDEPSIPSPVAPEDAFGNAVRDCRLPGHGCPNGFGCVRNEPAHPHYTGPDDRRPRRGECRAITAHLDWNGNGRLDPGVVQHRAGGSPGTTSGWSSDVDCDVSSFQALSGDSQRRTWTFRAELEECVWGQESPAPGTSTPDPFGIRTTAEFCQTGRLDRHGGIVVDGFKQVNVPVWHPLTNGVIDTCYWISLDDQFFDDHPYEDRNDFYELQFRWQPSAPECQGVLLDPDFEPGVSECVPRNYVCPEFAERADGE